MTTEVPVGSPDSPKRAFRADASSSNDADGSAADGNFMAAIQPSLEAPVLGGKPLDIGKGE